MIYMLNIALKSNERRISTNIAFNRLVNIVL